MKLICMFNGPPSIGKDVLGECLREKLNLPPERKHTLATGIIKQAAYYYKYPELVSLWGVEGFKDSYNDFLGQTPRRAVLDYSHKFVEDKPFNSVCRPVFNLIKEQGTSIITDLGFPREYQTFKCLEEEGFIVLVVHILHPDFKFGEDDRTYIEVDEEHLLSFTTTRGDIEGDSEKLFKLVLERINENGL